MLRILRDQHSSLRNARRESYVGELIRRLETREPDLVRTLDPEKRDAVVRGAIASARQYGFTSRGPIRLYLDLCVSFGSGVVEDPMYPWAAQAMGDKDPATQMQRAETLFEKSLTAYQEINGPRGEHARASLRALEDWARKPHDLHSLDEDLAVSQVRALHPQRAAHGGEEALRCLFRYARGVCQEFGTSAPRSITLMTALKFAFGAGCLNDPLYPWIAATLAMKRTDVSRRFARLERRALIWLDAVIKNQSVH